jgi:hypothetical protein
LRAGKISFILSNHFPEIGLLGVAVARSAVSRELFQKRGSMTRCKKDGGRRRE